MDRAVRVRIEMKWYKRWSNIYRFSIISVLLANDWYSIEIYELNVQS